MKKNEKTELRTPKTSAKKTIAKKREQQTNIKKITMKKNEKTELRTPKTSAKKTTAKKRVIDIEKIILPEKGNLIIKNQIATAKIIDPELDVLKCSFNYNNCVEIDTKGYTHITLSLENLRQLKKLIIESEIYYDLHFQKKYGF